MENNDNTNTNSDKTENIEEDSSKNKLKDSIFIYAAIFIILILCLIIFLPKIIPGNSQLTLEELHKRNLEGRLPPDKGYIYNGLHSFVFAEGLWHTQLTNPSGTTLFNLHFHFSPRDVESIIPVGTLNLSNLDRYQNFFMTFDPTDEDLAYIAASIGEIDFPLVQVFGKGVISACTNNENTACQGRPIVQCNSTDAPVFYFASEDETNLIYLDNCVIISGRQEGLFKATDRFLFELLGIMS
ncbi:MAG: hypothetical protein KAK00_05475 [Nanoarchaeota archaeon]|nr:hypothetical protein [Nanoarchaeota archaeon]